MSYRLCECIPANHWICGKHWQNMYCLNAKSITWLFWPWKWIISIPVHYPKNTYQAKENVKVLMAFFITQPFFTWNVFLKGSLQVIIFKDLCAYKRVKERGTDIRQCQKVWNIGTSLHYIASV
jgi:hypothetical protein